MLAQIRRYCLPLKHMARKHTTYHVSKSDIRDTRLKQLQKKNTQITFAISFGFAVEKKENKNICFCKTFCVTCKRS